MGLDLHKYQRPDNMLNMLDSDINEIEQVIDKDFDENKLKEMHRKMDAKYQNYIKNWGKSLWAYNESYGFAYDLLDKESLQENLLSMKFKMEAFLCEVKEKNVGDLHMGEKKLPKIFISHSHKDIAHVKRIVDFLEDLNVPEDGIFCSSIPEYGIPGGKKIYNYLREQFERFDLHVIFVLSENYYNSVASLNEMGAAWIMHDEYTTLLLPGFSYSDIKGVLDPSEIAAKIDDAPEMINARLSELRDSVIQAFGLPEIGDHKWERIRNGFIKEMLSITSENNIVKNNSLNNLDLLGENASIFLSKATEDISGQIVRTKDIIGNVRYSVNGNEIICQDGQEIKKWDAAISDLMKKQFIELVSTRGGHIYKVTERGYQAIK